MGLPGGFVSVFISGVGQSWGGGDGEVLDFFEAEQVDAGGFSGDGDVVEGDAVGLPDVHGGAQVGLGQFNGQVFEGDVFDVAEEQGR